MINKLQTNSDSLGSLASGICLLHCIATPILFVMHPLSAQSEGAPLWWSSLDFVFLLLAFAAVFWSAKNTSKTWVKYALWISFAALTFAVLNEKLELLHLGEIVVYIPAISLIGLHFYNRKYCQCEDEACCAHD